MRLKNSLYPYPVLADGRDDYNKNSKFSSAIHGKVEFNNVVISAKFNLNDDGLLNLIREGFAAFALHIECSKTAYRRKFYTRKFEYKVSIPVDDITDEIEVLGVVVALKRIDDYDNPNFNIAYQGIKVNIEKANILADSGQTILTLNDAVDYCNQESIFKVKKIHDEKDWIDLNFSQDEYVLICINESEYNTYMKLAKGVLKNTIMTMVMLPVMITVLNVMEKEKDEHEGKKWYKVISDKLESNDIYLDNINQTGDKSIFVIAQRIFQNPLKKAFSEIEMFPGEE